MGSNYQTDHVQVNVYSHKTKMFATVDENLSQIIHHMWDLGLTTQYSCQGPCLDGQAYILMDLKSARRFEKMLREAKLSPSSRITANMFLNADRLYDFGISRNRRTLFRKRFVTSPRDESRFLVERLYQNAPHWLRTTYRWNPEWTEAIEEMLCELRLRDALLGKTN